VQAQRKHEESHKDSDMVAADIAKSFFKGYTLIAFVDGTCGGTAPEIQVNYGNPRPTDKQQVTKLWARVGHGASCQSRNHDYAISVAIDSEILDETCLTSSVTTDPPRYRFKVPAVGGKGDIGWAFLDGRHRNAMIASYRVAPWKKMIAALEESLQDAKTRDGGQVRVAELEEQLKEAKASMEEDSLWICKVFNKSRFFVDFGEYNR
jgi:hypothetical protein